MIKRIKNKLKQVFLNRKKTEIQFSGSEKYWNDRYLLSGNSGSGSYGILAEYKAQIINEFVKKNKVETVTELGCGDGNQLKLSNYPKYFGYDVSIKAVEICKKQFKNESSKQFFVLNELSTILSSELALSLDVLYHLVEDEVFDTYMRKLFNSSTKYVLIYSSNYDKMIAKHVKSRKFTDWIDLNIKNEWTLIQKINNEYPFDETKPNESSISDFYIYEKSKSMK